MSAFNSLSIPMPDFANGMIHKGSLAAELEGLPEAEKSYYRRHKDLIGDPDEANSDSADLPLDRANLTSVLIQYLKSKQPDYLPDDYRQKAATQDFNMQYSDLSEDELSAAIQNIFDSEKQGQHFQEEIQSGNYDQNALIHEPGYSQYAMNQAYQQDPFGGIHGILLGMGLVRAFDRGNSGENNEQSSNRDENGDQTSTVNSKNADDKKTQGATDTNEASLEDTAKLRATEQSVHVKLDQYLLNPEHPVGGSKANWFQQALGFNRDNIDELAMQIKFDPNKAVETGVTQYGTKYNQVLKITGANGRQIDVTFAWIRNNDGVVRLVTAIPTGK